MKRLTMILLFVMLLPAANGCIHPPKGTTWLDVDGQTMLVMADEDGNPIRDPATGEYLIVADGKYVKTVDAADSLGSTLLITLGAIAGFPIAVGIGSVWKGARFGRLILNLVLSVQAARQALKDKGMAEALEVVNDSLSEEQIDATRDLVDKLKDKHDIHLQ